MPMRAPPGAASPQSSGPQAGTQLSNEGANGGNSSWAGGDGQLKTSVPPRGAWASRNPSSLKRDVVRPPTLTVREVVVQMDGAEERRDPKTSVNKLSCAGWIPHCRFLVWGCPGLKAGVDR